MEKQYIFDGNELIAQFVGAILQGTYPNGDKDESKLYHYGDKSIVPTNWCRTHSNTTMQYHTSWDWIMPVIKKLMSIRLMAFATYIDDNLYGQDDCIRDISNAFVSIDNEAIFKAVINYIKYIQQESNYPK